MAVFPPPRAHHRSGETASGRCAVRGERWPDSDLHSQSIRPSDRLWVAIPMGTLSARATGFGAGGYSNRSGRTFETPGSSMVTP